MVPLLEDEVLAPELLVASAPVLEPVVVEVAALPPPAPPVPDGSSDPQARTKKERGAQASRKCLTVKSLSGLEREARVESEHGAGGYDRSLCTAIGAVGPAGPTIFAAKRVQPPKPMRLH